MRKQLMKGNEAIVKSAILAGCRAFYGYPITPASEIAEAAAEYMPKTGGVFLQAESEVAAINMLYGAASAGVRAMTASSGPGISLMQEGISYMAGAELPCVIADITRGGPGLGNIGAEQGDYHQVVKGGGHGNYRTIVLAPHSVQEMADLTALAFDLADRYRNPVVVLADGFIGQMMEPVEFPQAATPTHLPAWAVAGTAATRGNLITSLHLDFDELEEHIRELEAKYKTRRAARSARRGVVHRRCGDCAGGLRHRGPHLEGRHGRGARRWAEGGRAAAHHALSVPDGAVPAAGVKRAHVRGGGDEQRPDAGRCAAGAERRAAGGVPEPHGRQRAVARRGAALCARAGAPLRAWHRAPNVNSEEEQMANV